MSRDVPRAVFHQYYGSHLRKRSWNARKVRRLLNDRATMFREHIVSREFAFDHLFDHLRDTFLSFWRRRSALCKHPSRVSTSKYFSAANRIAFDESRPLHWSFRGFNTFAIREHARLTYVAYKCNLREGKKDGKTAENLVKFVSANFYRIDAFINFLALSNVSSRDERVDHSMTRWLQRAFSISKA